MSEDLQGLMKYNIVLDEAVEDEYDTDDTVFAGDVVEDYLEPVSDEDKKEVIEGLVSDLDKSEVQLEAYAAIKTIEEIGLESYIRTFKKIKYSVEGETDVTALKSLETQVNGLASYFTAVISTRIEQKQMQKNLEGAEFNSKPKATPLMQSLITGKNPESIKMMVSDVARYTALTTELVNDLLYRVGKGMLSILSPNIAERDPGDVIAEIQQILDIDIYVESKKLTDALDSVIDSMSYCIFSRAPETVFSVTSAKSVYRDSLSMADSMRSLIDMFKEAWDTLTEDSSVLEDVKIEEERLGILKSVISTLNDQPVATIPEYKPVTYNYEPKEDMDSVVLDMTDSAITKSSSLMKDLTAILMLNEYVTTICHELSLLIIAIVNGSSDGDAQE